MQWRRSKEKTANVCQFFGGKNRVSHRTGQIWLARLAVAHTASGWGPHLSMRGPNAFRDDEVEATCKASAAKSWSIQLCVHLSLFVPSSSICDWREMTGKPKNKNSKRIGQQGVYTIFIATNSSWLEEDTFLRPTQALGRQIQNGQKFRKRRDSNLSATQSVTNANECLRVLTSAYECLRVLMSAYECLWVLRVRKVCMRPLKLT